MKHRWILTALLLLLMPALLCAAALSLPQIYQDSYYAELSPMTRRLYQAEGKRLILIGGSNVAFGIDAPMLEQLLRDKGFEYTVCPYGLYAAVGVSAMLRLSEGALREGDAVVLAVESSADTLSTYFGATAFLKCAEGDKSLIARLNGAQKQRIVGNFLPYLQEKYGVVRSGALSRAEGVYARAAFDEDCNLVYPREGNIMALGHDTAAPIALSELEIEPAFAAQVNEYCKTAAKKGASVFMSFSPMNRSAVTGGLEDGLNSYFTLCNATFDCPVISNPNDYVMDSGWFFDNNFHLNSAGAQIRTWQLARDLLAEWGCYEPLDCELPVMPEPAPIWAEADSSASADFVTEALDDPALCRVTGLTAEGREKRALSVPASIGGQTVVDILAEAFEGAQALEELRIPATVEVLPEGLVARCPGLKRLVLTHTDAPCGLRAHSLGGAQDLQILVPSAAYPWYRDGYGCEENPWRPYLGQIIAY